MQRYRLVLFIIMRIFKNKLDLEELLMKSFKIMGLTLCCLLFTSCGRKTPVANKVLPDYQVLSNGFPNNSIFFIEPVKVENPLFAQVIANKVAKKLHEHGFVTVENDNADKAQYSIACTIDTKALPHEASSEPATFNHCLQLKVYAVNNLNAPEQEQLLWQGSAYVKNLDKNPRDILDYLLTCALHHFGKNMQQQ